MAEPEDSTQVTEEVLLTSSTAAQEQKTTGEVKNSENGNLVTIIRQQSTIENIPSELGDVHPSRIEEDNMSDIPGIRVSIAPIVELPPLEEQQRFSDENAPTISEKVIDEIFSSIITLPEDQQQFKPSEVPNHEQEPQSQVAEANVINETSDVPPAIDAANVTNGDSENNLNNEIIEVTEVTEVETLLTSEASVTTETIVTSGNVQTDQNSQSSDIQNSLSSSIQNVQSAPVVQSAQVVENSQSSHVQGIQNPQNNVQDVQNEQNVSVIKDVQSVPPAQNIQIVQNVQDVQSIQSTQQSMVIDQNISQQQSEQKPEQVVDDKTVVDLPVVSEAAPSIEVPPSQQLQQLSIPLAQNAGTTNDGVHPMDTLNSSSDDNKPPSTLTTPTGTFDYEDAIKKAHAIAAKLLNNNEGGTVVQNQQNINPAQQGVKRTHEDSYSSHGSTRDSRDDYRDDYRRDSYNRRDRGRYDDYGRDSKRAAYDGGSSRPECNFCSIHLHLINVNYKF
ncbi:hypothetical protein C1645_126901 [Glomus cerebriforme]|uniref:Uncharacterized protein n=1 Tax=Glomus cerebriforme TaxID=658196 RepID=A0A397T097_9GLOM|nr:hypothetical protein C1645_126901 [Glomus cerebriforme]